MTACENVGMRLSVDTAARGIAAVAAHPGIAPEFSSRIASALRTAVPFDGWCLFGVDPRTGLRTVQFGQNGTEGTAWMAQNEAFMHDVNSYRDLATSARPAGWLSRIHPAARTSARLNEILIPQGYSSELRLVLRSSGLVWGALVLFRARPGPSFTDEDATDVCSLGGPLAQAIRSYTARGVPRSPTVPGAGAITVAATDGLSISNEAREWLDDLVPGGDDETFDRDVTRVVFEAAHAIRRGASTQAAATVRTVSGHWLRVEGVAPQGEADDVTVVLHPATGNQRIEAVGAYHQLTHREKEVLNHLAGGLTTGQIARRMNISAFTVNEHLRSTYRKSGTKGRQELLAQLI